MSRLAASAVPILLALAVATGAEARDTSVTIRLKAVKGRIESVYRGKLLTDAKLTQLCAAAKARRAEINFQHDKMNSNDIMAALLKEADCLGAQHAGPPPVAPKSTARTHAKPRRRAAAPQ